MDVVLHLRAVCGEIGSGEEDGSAEGLFLVQRTRYGIARI